MSSLVGMLLTAVREREASDSMHAERCWWARAGGEWHEISIWWRLQFIATGMSIGILIAGMGSKAARAI